MKSSGGGTTGAKPTGGAAAAAQAPRKRKAGTARRKGPGSNGGGGRSGTGGAGPNPNGGAEADRFGGGPYEYADEEREPPDTTGERAPIRHSADEKAAAGAKAAKAARAAGAKPGRKPGRKPKAKHSPKNAVAPAGVPAISAPASLTYEEVVPLAAGAPLLQDDAPRDRLPSDDVPRDRLSSASFDQIMAPSASFGGLSAMGLGPVDAAAVARTYATPTGPQGRLEPSLTSSLASPQGRLEPSLTSSLTSPLPVHARGPNGVPVSLPMGELDNPSWDLLNQDSFGFNLLATQGSLSFETNDGAANDNEGRDGPAGGGSNVNPARSPKKDDGRSKPMDLTSAVTASLEDTPPKNRVSEWAAEGSSNAKHGRGARDEDVKLAVNGSNHNWVPPSPGASANHSLYGPTSYSHHSHGSYGGSYGSYTGSYYSSHYGGGSSLHGGSHPGSYGGYPPPYPPHSHPPPHPESRSDVHQGYYDPHHPETREGAAGPPPPHPGPHGPPLHHRTYEDPFKYAFGDPGHSAADPGRDPNPAAVDPSLAGPGAPPGYPSYSDYRPGYPYPRHRGKSNSSDVTHKRGSRSGRHSSSRSSSGAGGHPSPPQIADAPTSAGSRSSRKAKKRKQHPFEAVEPRVPSGEEPLDGRRSPPPIATIESAPLSDPRDPPPPPAPGIDHAWSASPDMRQQQRKGGGSGRSSSTRRKDGRSHRSPRHAHPVPESGGRGGTWHGGAPPPTAHHPPSYPPPQFHPPPRPPAGRPASGPGGYGAAPPREVYITSKPGGGGGPPPHAPYPPYPHRPPPPYHYPPAPPVPRGSPPSHTHAPQQRPSSSGRRRAPPPAPSRDAVSRRSGAELLTLPGGRRLTRSQAPGIGWPPEEDLRLAEVMSDHKTSSVDWKKLADDHGCGRTPRECHDRWTRYLKPGSRKGQWKEEEDAIVLRAIFAGGEANAPGDKDKNGRGKGGSRGEERTTREGGSRDAPSFTQWADLAPQLPGRTGKQIRDRWVNYLNPAINHLPFSREDDLRLWRGHADLGKRWVEISVRVFRGTRSENHIKNRWYSAAFKKFAAREFGMDAYVDAKRPAPGGRQPLPPPRSETAQDAEAAGEATGTANAGGRPAAFL